MQSMKYLPLRKQMRISRFVKLQVVILPILRTCKPFSPFWTQLLWIDRFYFVGILVNAILLICMYQDANHEITSCVVMAASETRLMLLCCDEG